LGNIRECNALLHVLRCFENDNIVHVDGSVNPLRDKETIDFELQLKDLETLEKRIDRARKAAKSGAREGGREVEMGERLKKHIEQGKSVRGFDRTEEENTWIADYQLLTDKPVMYVCNVEETSAKTGNAWVEKVRAMAVEEGAGVLHLAAATEADIAELETYEERRMFLDDLELEEPGVNRLIREAYNLLQLHTYFTAGVKEVRAWTIPRGSTAPQAAGVIHSDFEKGFIRAEVIGYDDYIKFRTEAACREAGRLRVEGRDYCVKDGDVLHFRFNV
jgi:GTP-binding protein YchF